jgi:hypothetical protein
LGYSNGRRQDWRIYLEASASKEELDGGLLRDYWKDEHQNSPHPFNFTPTTKYFRSTIELAITVRNADSRHVRKSKGSLSAPPGLDCMCCGG